MKRIDGDLVRIIFALLVVLAVAKSPSDTILIYRAKPECARP